MYISFSSLLSLFFSLKINWIKNFENFLELWKICFLFSLAVFCPDQKLLWASNFFVLCCKSHSISIFPILPLFIFNRLQSDLRWVFYWDVSLKNNSNSSLYDRSMKFYRLYSLLQNKVLLTWKQDGLLAIFIKSSPLLWKCNWSKSESFIITTYIY